MAQRKDSPNTPTRGGSPKAGETGGGNSKTTGAGGGRGAASHASGGAPQNTTARREKASPSGRDRGERSSADRA